MFLPISHTAKADIKGGKEFPHIHGTVTFKEVKNGIMLTAKIHGLPKSQTQCQRKIFWLSYS